MPYELDPLPDNCYPGTSVLINKLGIKLVFERLRSHDFLRD